MRLIDADALVGGTYYVSQNETFVGYTQQEIDRQPTVEMAENCVNREDVKIRMIKYGFLAPDMTVTEFVEDIPSVQPQPKTGHWIPDVDRWGDIVTTVNGYRCSECNAFNTDKDNYCPQCGAKMEVEENG